MTTRYEGVRFSRECFLFTPWLCGGMVYGIQYVKRRVEGSVKGRILYVVYRGKCYG